MEEFNSTSKVATTNVKHVAQNAGVERPPILENKSGQKVTEHSQNTHSLS